MQLHTGQKVAEYVIVETLDRGGQYIVYRARKLNLPKEVAIKVLLSGSQAAETDMLRLRRDAETLAKLRHPHIVEVYDIGTHDGTPYIAMELCRGGSLESRVGTVPIEPTDAARLVQKLAEAIQAVHYANVLHCDLKPANVLLTEDGTPKLTDFGLAKMMELLDDPLCPPGAIRGSIGFMAPEQARGNDPTGVGRPADIYGLGAILYKLLTGRPPFQAATIGDTLLQTLNDEPAPPRLLNPEVPPALEAICLKCLEKNPVDRYATAGKLADDLQRFLDQERTEAEDKSWKSWLRSHLSRQIRFEHADRWSTIMFWDGGLSFLAHALFYFMLRHQPSALLCWAWFLVVVSLAEWGPWLVMRSRWRFEPKEREILLLWIGVSIAKVLFFSMFCPLTGPVDPDTVVSFYPVSLTVNGLMLFVEGRLYGGRLYLVGLADFVAAALLPLRLDLAPLLMGAWNALALFYIGIALLRESARQARADQRRLMLRLLRGTAN
jgi:serine/threonine-protein kinase